MIIERLPESILNFLKEVESLGFVMTLVGGAPRDFFFADTIGADLDFEIRASVDVQAAHWAAYHQRFLDFLKHKNYSYKVLPYLITRVEIGTFQLEFSSPRTETNREDNFSHHHFDAVLDSQFSYQDSFRRRDFTINAIGIKLDVKNKKDELVDPYGGLHDLKAGLLKPVSEDFYHDSVRFLRLIRFQLKFNRFVMDADLISNLKRFNLSGLSQHYFKEEMFKSTPGKFINLFTKLISEHHLSVPSEFNVWMKYSFAPELKTREELVGFVFQQDKKDAEKVSHFLNLPAKILKDVDSFTRSLQILSSIKVEDLKALAQKPEEEALADSFFKEVKNCEEKKNWFEFLHFNRESLLFGPDDWKDAVATSESLHKVKPALRSYLPYLLALKTKYKT